MAVYQNIKNVKKLFFSIKALQKCNVICCPFQFFFANIT
jgi:hypothetical protein